MTVNELIKTLLEAQRRGQGDERLYMVSASSGDPNHKESATFPLIGFNAQHGVIITSNQIVRYIPATFPEAQQEGAER